MIGRGRSADQAPGHPLLEAAVAADDERPPYRPAGHALGSLLGAPAAVLALISTKSSSRQCATPIESCAPTGVSRRALTDPGDRCPALSVGAARRPGGLHWCHHGGQSEAFRVDREGSSMTDQWPELEERTLVNRSGHLPAALAVWESGQ